MWDNVSEHDSIVDPVCQDLLDLGIAKAEEAQGGAIILERMIARGTSAASQRARGNSDHKQRNSSSARSTLGSAFVPMHFIRLNHPRDQ